MVEGAARGATARGTARSGGKFLGVEVPEDALLSCSGVAMEGRSEAGRDDTGLNRHQRVLFGLLLASKYC